MTAREELYLRSDVDLNASRVFHTFYRIHNVSVVSCHCCACILVHPLHVPGHTVRNLGVVFDSELSMKSHISKTASACFCPPEKAVTTARCSDWWSRDVTGS